jgi:amino acid adenylation domain-containing protein
MSGPTLDPHDTPLTPPAAADESIMLPASFAQELLWLSDRAAPGSVAYNVPRTRRLVGPLDVDALRRAFDALVDRHEILRTTYATHDEQAVQVIHPPRPVPFEVVDLSPLAAEAREAEALRIVRERSARPFDLASDLLLRVTLLRLDAAEHVLLFESHHIAFDGWSRDVVFRELAAFYEAFARGETPKLPALPIQFADYAIWQREQLQGERLATLLGWWREELGDAEHVLRLPTDFPRPNVSRYEGVSRTVRLEPELRDAVRRLGQRHDATPYMVVLAAYATVLHRYTGQPDVLVGSPIAGRAQPETEGLIGYLANTIVQRARFAGDPTFGAVLARLRESALGAYDHQDVPFEKLVLELEGRAAAAGVSPLFQVVLTQLDSSHAPAPRMGDVTLASFGLDAATTKFDLTLFMSDRADGLSLTLRARSDLHRPDSVERFLGHLRSVLEAAVVDADVRVSRIPLLTVAERAQLAAWNQTAVDEGAPATLVSLFEAQAARVPERTAVVGHDASLAYAELNGRANRLARHLQSLGVAPSAPVGLLLDRSAEALVGLLGILKSGGAYTPLSVEAPPARIAAQLAESGAKVVVTNAAGAARLPASVQAVALDRDAATLGALPDANLEPSTTPDDLAYVLYTSGSTGTPKGVAVTHANAVHYARAIGRVLGEGDGVHFGLASTLAADLGNTSLLGALLSGGTLHVLAKDVATDPARFAEYVSTHPLDVLKIAPSHALALAAVPPRRWLVVGGEALRPDVARTFLSAGTGRLLNHYGPTEATVGALTLEVTGDSLAAAESLGVQTVPLGRPLANARAYVVDAHGNEQPVGVPGELLLGGGGIARGYLGRDDLTAERFVEHQGERVYRTGDRVRRLPDGTLEFLGRTDDQVKVRGFRVELGEIEQVLRAHPGVGQAVVALRDEELVAYVVPKQAGYAVSHADRPTREKLVEWLATQLPEYMVPNAIVLLDALPLTPNGKVDKRALPAPEGDAVADAFVAPRTPTEEQLATIWREVLKKERVGATDNFLALGGHSLLAIRVLGRISKAFGVRLPLRTLFDASTVEQLAEVVDLETKLAALERMSDEDAARLLAADGTPGGRD